MLNRYRLHGGRVADEAVDVGQRELHGLYLVVIKRRRVRRRQTEPASFQHAQRHQRRDALSVGTDLMQLDIAIARVDRRYPIGLVLGQVRFVDQATAGACMRSDCGSNAALIEIGATAACNSVQRIRLPRADEALTWQRRSPTRRERGSEAGEVADHGQLFLPLAADRGGYEVAVACIADRGFK